jgi:hypothetical protein
VERPSVGKALQARLTDSIAELINERSDEVLAELRETRAELRETREQLADALRMLEVRHRRDMVFAGEVRAVRETERFVAENLPRAKPFPNPEKTMEFAAELVDVEGSVLQFGVADGASLDLLVHLLHLRKIYGFDSFAGLPEDWRPGFPAGTFARSAAPDVPGATLVQGLFADTVPGFLAEHPEPVALLHLNADLYSSTKTVLDLVGERLVTGSVVVLDSYFNYPGWQLGEFRAWAEFVERAAVEFRYEGYTFDNEQVVVRLTSVPD